MGTSNWQNISYCVEIIRKINPQRILDIGVGFGRWGILSREFLEVWQGRIHRKDWKLEVDGIEVFKDNIEEYHKYFYNNIFNTDALEFLRETDKRYDLIILGDVLEHFTKQNAVNVLIQCINISDFVMLNIPIGNLWKQDNSYENPYEKHLSCWQMNEFDSFKPIKIKTFHDEIYRKFAVVVFSRNGKLKDYLTFKEKVRLNLVQLPRMYSFIKRLINK